MTDEMREYFSDHYCVYDENRGNYRDSEMCMSDKAVPVDGEEKSTVTRMNALRFEAESLP